MAYQNSVCLKVLWEKEVENIKKLGVEIKVNSVIGKLWTIDELMNEEGYDAVYVSTGAGLPYFMDIPGKISMGYIQQ